MTNPNVLHKTKGMKLATPCWHSYSALPSTYSNSNDQLFPNSHSRKYYRLDSADELFQMSSWSLYFASRFCTVYSYHYCRDLLLDLMNPLCRQC